MLFIVFYHVERIPSSHFFFFFNDTATTEIYTLSLHDALPIWKIHARRKLIGITMTLYALAIVATTFYFVPELRAHTESRSEEHTSELQSRSDLVCRLLLEKKKKDMITRHARSRDAPSRSPGAA